MKVLYLIGQVWTALTLVAIAWFLVRIGTLLP